jgi:undecaprenyl-diphosphatase
VNDYLLSVVLGIVEGVTEFLPVSSTAHLRITEALVGVNLADGYWTMFTIVIQLGAVCCLPFYFRARLARFLASFPAGERGDRTLLTHPLTLTFAAFVCTSVPSLLFIKLIGKHLESLAVMGAALVAGGVVMWVVDALAERGTLPRRTEHMEEMGPAQAVWIGLCQTLSAVVPGTSRSMATIAAGQLAGMSRSSALEFSFFLSMPTMAAASGYDLLKSVRHGAAAPLGAVHMTPHLWAVLAIGFAVSFVVAYGVVAWFMHWVRRRGFVPFAVYRLLAGAAVLAWAAQARA